MENADVYVFEGTNRKEATNLIENNDKLYPGNPLKITTHSDLMLVFKKTLDGYERTVYSYTQEDWFTIFETVDGSFEITYVLSGEKHPFYRRPFVGEPEAYWYMFLVAFGLVCAAILALIVYTFIVRPVCLKKPICCCKAC